MKKYRKKISFFLFILILAALIYLFGGNQPITFEALKKNADAMTGYVREHYLIGLFTFAAAIFSTAFFSPGALLLTVTGGFLFGAMPGAVYASVFSTVACTLAFLLSRHFIGRSVQKRFKKQLKRFNEEMSRHGPNYLFVLRIVPILPSFAINYLAGVTHISTARFMAASLLGICPGAIVYSFAGSRLAAIENPKDILSANVVTAFLLLAGFALLPVLHRLFDRMIARRKQKIPGP